MAYGYATHLWIDGAPDAETLRQWVVGGLPDATERDLEVFRLGNRTLVSAINIDDRDVRWRSIRLVESVAGQLPDGVRKTFVNLQPDVESYEVNGEIDLGDAAQMAAAKAQLRRLVPLELEEIYHYVDWAHELEEAEEGSPVPSLPGVLVQRVLLGLPPGEAHPVKVHVPMANGEKVRQPWLWICLAVVAAAVFLKIVL
jgi:hypothetical protein